MISHSAARTPSHKSSSRQQLGELLSGAARLAPARVVALPAAPSRQRNWMQHVGSNRLVWEANRALYCVCQYDFCPFQHCQSFSFSQAATSKPASLFMPRATGRQLGPAGQTCPISCRLPLGARPASQPAAQYFSPSRCVL